MSVYMQILLDNTEFDLEVNAENKILHIFPRLFIRMEDRIKL
jgi:hypothetical protein